jgi:hypothetical protein
MNMKIVNICFLALISLGIAGEIHSQSRKKLKAQKPFNFKLNKDKPTVFITFERYQTFVYERTKESFDMVVLRIHNNSKGTITFSSYDGSVSPWGKTTIHYRAELIPDESKPSTRNNEKIPPGVPDTDVFSELEIKSGKSFLFVVFKEDLEKGKRIKIQFSYPWEDAFYAFNGSEPEHLVYFDSDDLDR